MRNAGKRKAHRAWRKNADRLELKSKPDYQICTLCAVRETQFTFFHQKKQAGPGFAEKRDAPRHAPKA
jgi:hypothetical protein